MVAGMVSYVITKKLVEIALNRKVSFNRKRQNCNNKDINTIQSAPFTIYLGQYIVKGAIICYDKNSMMVGK